ncbi:unnamed protein product [Paramecium sonneborni]|uniref:Uncharacterized protein n=1 Tax=Paramecium sonneborni TaxID=65129 RepID=A0A8S1QZY3_9CILI|nr:unnamed protein product [Paramecium sonneborni]CAD8121336.1 unnamed protein product [Paramecium sonneborni]
MDQIQLQCQIHDKIIVGFCTQINCQHKKPCCFECQKNDHNNHSADILDNSKLIEMLKSSLETIDKARDYFQQIRNFQESLGEYINKFNFQEQEDFSSLSFQGLNVLIDKLIQLKYFGQKLIPQLQELAKKVSTIQSDINKLKKSQIAELNLPSQKQQIIQPSVEVSLNKNWKFSESDKFKSINIVIDGNKIENFTNKIGFIILEPEINVMNQQKYIFKILQCKWIVLGLCHKQFLNLKKALPDFYSDNHGTYLVNNEGQIYSHISKSENYTNKQFGFSKDDEILIEVDSKQKKIIWQNLNQKNILSLKIDITQKLHIIIGLNNSKIEISK